MAHNRPIFDLLLDKPNLELNIKSSEEHMPLYYALLKYESGDDEDDSYASRLIEKEVQTNPIYSSNCDSLLQVLLTYGAHNATIFLVDHVQNINHVNMNGESALHTGCTKNAATFLRKLLQIGANPNLVSTEMRQAPLHYTTLNKSEDCIKVFIEYNEGLESNADKNSPKVVANFNIRDINGDTPLSLALNLGYKELVPVLIKGKADVNVRNGKDFTLLHQAILNEDSKTAMFLLDHGADINAK